jgi:putative spermidine/putrescine transport system substrate-binding protein
MKRSLYQSSVGLAGVAVMALGLFVATPSAEAGMFDGQKLTVATFGGSWRDRIKLIVGKAFEAEGGTIEFIVGNAGQNLQSMIAARGQKAPFDVMEITDEHWGNFVEGDFVQKLDLSKIPNTKDVDPALFDDFKVGNWIVLEGLVYNIAKFKELGLPRPTTFSELDHPKLKGKLHMSDSSNFTGLYTISVLAHENGGSESNIQPGLDKIKSMDMHSYSQNAVTVNQMLKSGELYATFAHCGWAVRNHDAGTPVGCVHPVVNGKRGAPAVGYAAIAKGSKNAAAAHFYINELVGFEMQELFHVKNGIVPVNNKVLEQYYKMPKLDSEGVPFLILDPKEVANFWYLDYSKYDAKGWQRAWDRTLLN